MRCDQLMKAAEKEIEIMEKKYNSTCDIPGETKIASLPSFKQLQSLKRQQMMQEYAAEEQALRLKVTEAENQIETLKKRMKALQESADNVDQKPRKSVQEPIFPSDFLAPLANLVAQSGSASTMTISTEFCSQHNTNISKKIVCGKIEEIAKKEKRQEEGDRKAVWYLLPEYTTLLTKETTRKLNKARAERQDTKRDRHTMTADHDHQHSNPNDGAQGPDGEFVHYPHYDGTEEPKEARRAFTLFCSGSRREVKESLDADSRSNKVRSCPIYRNCKYCNPSFHRKCVSRLYRRKR